MAINSLTPELNPICYLLALLGAHHFLHVSRIRVNVFTLNRAWCLRLDGPVQLNIVFDCLTHRRFSVLGWLPAVRSTARFQL